MAQRRKGFAVIRQRGEKQFMHEKAAEMAVRKPIIHLYRLHLVQPNVVESSLLIRNKNAIIGRSNCNIS